MRISLPDQWCHSFQEQNDYSPGTATEVSEPAAGGSIGHETDEITVTCVRLLARTWSTIATRAVK